ncbi:DUF6479 family protein [Streptomyces sp. NPDC019396]|uniref:DUF6479 family protein n=1 Tax=Streptomyces sp. NPDC019396 TaxID=3154687 RepID=UPI00340355E0
MNSLTITDQAAASQLAGIGPFIIGLVLIALLAGAMWYEGRRRAQEKAPLPEEQPKAPDHPTHIEEAREPDADAFPTDGARLLPYNMKTHSSHAAPAAEPPTKPGEPAQSTQPAQPSQSTGSETGTGTGTGRSTSAGGGSS